MDIAGKVVAITGAGGGIGKALAEACAAAGAKHVAVSDLNEGAARAVAESIGGSGYRVDAGKGEEITRFIEDVERTAGPIDLYCSNAGVLVVDADFDNCASAPDDAWAKAWAVNVMAHVHAVRALLPGWKARGGGYFLMTVSAAGLLSQIGGAPYATTKHAALGFAESLAISHKDDGVRVSALCPQAVDTAMTQGKTMMGADIDGVISAEQVAQSALEGVAQERFLILPHPSVTAYRAAKAENYERWIGGMAKMRRVMKGT
jgi:NAD(P)-dependent dehydrogenase (short-subunit alcohol dehydrogenase family)